MRLLVIHNGRNPHGGVQRSARLVKATLEKLGDEVQIDHRVADSTASFDAVWFYGWLHGGDGRPGRGPKQDRMRLGRLLSTTTVPVLINVAHDCAPRRRAYILRLLESHPRAVAVVWTQAALADLGHHERVAVLPKAFRDDIPAPDEGATRSGYCLGDASDLAKGWIRRRSIAEVRALAKRLNEEFPETPFCAFRAWRGNVSLPGVKTVVPRRFLEWLGTHRGIIHLSPGESFGMTVLEAQAMGVPVVAPYMPHALSEYVGSTGLFYRDDDDIVAAVRILEDDRYWRPLSEASRLNAAARSCELHAPALHFGIERAVSRARS